MLPIYEKVAGLTDNICQRQLNSEYRDLARAMAALHRKRPSPLTSGQPRTWACGIANVLGRIKFLGDRSLPTHMTTAELCAGFQIGEGTVYAEAGAVENALGIGSFDPRWTLPSLAERNPLLGMAEANGPLRFAGHATRGLGNCIRRGIDSLNSGGSPKLILNERLARRAAP
jgi:hypothetical protein